VRLQRLPTQRSAVEKVKLATIMKLTTSVSNGWLAAGETEKRGFRAA
jgi:hypothetical protein